MVDLRDGGMTAGGCDRPPTTPKINRFAVVAVLDILF